MYHPSRNVSSENKEKFAIEYQAGRAAFERGEYRVAIQRLLAAIAMINRNSPIGGEAQIWLVTAYEAAGQKTEAVTLCEQLSKHPDFDTRKQGKRLLYILQAPQLTRPAEWMIKIPDLGKITDTEPKNIRGSGNFTSTKSTSRPTPEPELIDPNLINTKDNQFIWLSLIALALTVGGLIWFGA
ncbi:MAG: hypothetical protein F6K36_13815 [Symploca sp. SIO3C6]|uniref:Tetratricopeptide repeat protein n=1 Tax=Symploca sp. SIO1C4 TaxID=2607765 RepID=A0A6B3NJS2_9CYAN|nr:hypothetical protein [Symploca sp. SIO3C6]NER29468.1 hypothetical protein [Symploca sp. SIO1C4]NET07187.1 hypothetical protein [Symploca sp. SIO2B6]NET53098.1 hypothetical protein [Merismopedia sp. SIO2A8]